jgi:lipoprotein-anchoring transpeptidase ErfK/SrfK
MKSRRNAAGLALLLVLTLAGCGGDDPAPAPAVLVPLPKQAQPGAASVDRAAAPPAKPVVVAEDDSATPLAESPRATTGPARQAPPGRLTVQVTKPVRLHAGPGGPVIGGILPKTEFSSDTLLPVVRQRGSWLGVISSALPNGRIGWISTNTALVAYRTRYSVVASLGRREVVVRRAGRVVLRFPVAVGSPSTPTPTGRFAVTDKLLTEDPGSPYGCCILALSAHQTQTPQGWGGGDRVAIHATNLPETIGTAASLGCLRGPADEVRRIVDTVPLGTIVTIQA